MGGIGFIILIIVVVSIYRTITNAAKEANAKATKQTITESEEDIENIPKTVTPKPVTPKNKYTAIKNQVKQTQEEEPQSEIKLDSIEEVRRAIIYSEIINRKY